MKLCFMAVHDDAVKAFGQPFFTRTVNEARRSFEDGVKQKPICDHPHDYSLWHLGEWDDAGKVEMLKQPALVCHGRDFSPAS